MRAELIKSHLDTLLFDDLKSLEIHAWVAGGCIRDLMRGNTNYHDVDLFFTCQSHWDKCKLYLMSMGGSVVWESENGMKIEIEDVTYDLVKIMYDGPFKTIESFDFTVCMMAYDGHSLIIPEKAKSDLNDNKLRINKITHPISTLKRSYRYAKKGFEVPNDTVLRMLNACQQSNNSSKENPPSGNP